MFYFYTFLLHSAFLLSVNPIAQDQDYHRFAGDGPPTAGAWIPNAANVISNLAFALVGVYGLLLGHQTVGWLGFSAASLAVCLGSAYYHWNPSDATLVWDRLPMTLCTTSAAYELFRAYGVKLGLLDLAGWWAYGLLAVAAWRLADDLRLYAFVQYAPVLALNVLAMVHPPVPGVDGPMLILAITVYVIARVVEHFDRFFFLYTPLSGHVWKHLLCAVAMFMVMKAKK